MSQHAPTRLCNAIARRGAIPALWDDPVLPCASPRNLHFALARWRPSRGLLRLRICTQPSVVPFWASLFSQHLLAAQARAAVEARLGPDRASFCVPQGAGQPSCKAVELAQAAWEAGQCHSMPQHACVMLSHAEERSPPCGMTPCSPAQAPGTSILRLHVGGLPEGCCA